MNGDARNRRGLLRRLERALTVLVGRDTADKLYWRAMMKRLKESKREVSKRAYTVLVGVLAGKSFRQAAREAGYSEAYLRKRPQRIWETIRNVFWEQQANAQEVAWAINVLFDAIARLEPLERAEDEKA
jgi:hypothetical protein